MSLKLPVMTRDLVPPISACCTFSFAEVQPTNAAASAAAQILSNMSPIPLQQLAASVGISTLNRWALDASDG